MSLKNNKYECLVQLLNDEENLGVQTKILVGTSSYNITEKWKDKYIFLEEPKLLEKEDTGSGFSFGGKVSLRNKDLLWLFKRLGGFKGLPFSKKIEILKRQARGNNLIRVIRDIEKIINEGGKLSSILERKEYSKIIKPYIVKLIKIGEQTGKEEEVFSLLAQKMEIQRKIRGKAISAMIYPGVVITMVVGVVIFLMLYLVPNFKEMFEGSEDKIPGITKMLFNMSDYLVNNYVSLIVFSILGIVILYQSIKNVYILRKIFYKILLATPIVGPIIKKTYETFLLQIIYFGEYAIEVGSETFTKQHLGEFLEESIDNPLYKEKLKGLAYHISKGENGIGGYLEKYDKFFSFELISYVQYGEESLTLKEQSNTLYNENIDDLLTFYEGIGKIIEPLLIVVLGFVVGFIVGGVFYGIFSISDTI